MRIQILKGETRFLNEVGGRLLFIVECSAFHRKVPIDTAYYLKYAVYKYENLIFISFIYKTFLKTINPII